MQTKPTRQKLALSPWAICVWLVVWQLAALIIDQEILLVSPVSVLVRFFALAQTGEFWLSLGTSFLRIASGFFLAVLLGLLLAISAAKYKWVKQLFAPFMLTIQSIPVASFVILALIWFSSESLSVLISFLMVLPIFYTNVLEGIAQTDGALLEMAQVFGVNKAKTIRYIYFFEVYPFLYAALRVSLGLCWKSGIAAEVIGIPNRSIGVHLFQAKLYLDTASLFAWTLAILLLSIAFERMVLFGLSALHTRMKGAQS